MPFIGKQPQVGAYSKLDAITTSATATYNLTLGSGAYYPQSANHLLVSLNGVMQAPQDSFTVSGSTITFASALTSSDSVDFIMALGDTLDIGTPSDGTVTSAKLSGSITTPSGLTVTDGLIVQGAFTSLGIDDNATSTAMTIDSSGNVLVGKTSNSFGTAGVALNPDGSNNMTRSGDPALALNRLSSDGAILGLYKDGTTVGSIGTQGGDLWVGTGDVGAYFWDGSSTIAPWNPSTNTARDNAIDLGTSGVRFKDLYLSGGVYLGGTGSANLLDDYEEGTYTPTVGGGTTAGTRTYTQQTGVYTKIGNMVRFSGSVQWANNSGGTGNMVITLPFATSSSASYQGNFTLGYQFGLNDIGYVGYNDGGRTDFYIRVDGSVSAIMGASNLTGSGHIIFGGTFQTDA